MRLVSTPPANLLQTVARAVSIIEIVSSAPQGLTILETAEQCDFSSHIVRHHFPTLTYLRYLMPWDDRRYTIGPAIADLRTALAVQLSYRHRMGASVGDLATDINLPVPSVARLLHAGSASADQLRPRR